MKDTSFLLVNNSLRKHNVTLEAFETDAEFTFYLNESIIQSDKPLIVKANKKEEITINPGNTLTVRVDTLNGTVVTEGNGLLSFVYGPIAKSRLTDSKGNLILKGTFKGCDSLRYISDDSLIRNTDAVALIETFKDCVNFQIGDCEFLKPLEHIELLDNTFVNTDIKYINRDTTRYFGLKPKVLRETFKNCAGLESINTDVFVDSNIVELIETFKNCPRIETVHPQFFENLNEYVKLDRVFSECGISKIDKNLLSYMPMGAITIDIFKDNEYEIELNNFN